MANSPQAIKRARQNDKRRLHMTGQRSALRTAIKKVRAAISAGDGAAARDEFKAAEPTIDRGVTHGLIAKNAAARYKSRLNKSIRQLG